MQLIIRTSIFLGTFYTVYTLCNTCSAITGLACVANDQFSVCVDGLPTSSITQCPNGTVCTATAKVCSPAETAQPSCGMCGVCNGNSTFACTSYNTFALCYGTTVPGSVNYTCANSTICYYDDPQICVDPALTGFGGTCPLTTLNPTTTTTQSSIITSTSASPGATTTPSPTISPQAFCANVTASGRFDVTTDTTCKKYVYCTLLNSTWVGNKYECPGSTFFNSTTGLCGVQVPLRCAT